MVFLLSLTIFLGNGLHLGQGGATTVEGVDLLREPGVVDIVKRVVKASSLGLGIDHGGKVRSKLGNSGVVLGIGPARLDLKS